MSQEELTCRICSAPGEQDQPLFHPCKCSGSIRYIHQDCLTTWLAHSKKKTCDICKHPYSFQKVYSPDMPERLPVLLLLRQLSRQAFNSVLFCMRAIVVATVWLALVPWATIWTWRMYFAMGDSTAWWISNREKLQHKVNGTTSSLNITANTPINSTTSFLSHPIVRSISSDIVSGQIISSVIVLAFVAIFLLREWIMQNARPGVFEDGEVPAGDAAQGAPEPPVDPEPPVQEQPLQVPPPAVPEGNGHVVQQFNRPPEDDGRGPSKRVRRDNGPGENGPLVRRPTPRLARDKGKRVERREYIVGTAGRGKLRRRHPLRESSESPEDEVAYRDASEQPNNGSRPPMDLGEEAQFTFRLPGEASESAHSSCTDDSSDMSWTVPSQGPVSTDISSWNPNFGEDSVHDTPPASLHSAVPDVPEDVSLPSPADVSTPIDIHSTQEMPSPTLVPASSDATLSDSETEDTVSRSLSAPLSASLAAPGTPGELRRPPLPSVTLPSPSSGVPASISRGATPLASPSLATYRAPEEFEAGPSNLSGYFGRRDSEEEMEEMRAEHNRYFATEEREQDNESLGGVEVDEDGEGPKHAGGAWSESQGHLEVDVQPAQEEHAQPPQPAADGAPAQPPLNVEDVQRVIDAAADLGARLEELNQQLDAIQVNLDENIDDDMDGALEAIGLRGPLHGVAQNAALMTFILDVTIGLGIWVPFTLGKTTALLSLDPPRFLYILHLPLRVIRLVTDPIVDGVAILFTRLFLPPIFRFLHLLLAPLLSALKLGQGSSEAQAAVHHDVRGSVQDLMKWVCDKIKERFSAPSDTASSQPPVSFVDRVLQSDSPVFRYIEPYFAPLGSKVRSTSEDAKLTWGRLAVGDGPNDKIFAIVLGYAVMGLLVALYLNVLTIGNVRNAGKAVRSAVRQQLLVVKVAAFIVVELVVFPLGCGVMLDVCTVWLVPQGNFRSRITFLTYAPVTSVFYHWVAGTMFMYQFAVLLAGCRDIMRPGSMWFIKDPQDQNFHPIRDILERPALVQIRKLLLSGIMYSLVVAAGVGTVSGVLQLFSKSILPFRWNIREPLSPVPIDLLFLHLVLPYTMQYFRPKKALRQIGSAIWKSLAAHLRLSSYMFGGRHPTEEYTPKRWSHKLFGPTTLTRFELEELRDGVFRRVPNSDNVALVKDLPATAEVDANENPLNEEQARIIAAQNAEAEKHKRNIKNDYTVVYLPPQLKYRVAVFILSMWITGSLMLAIALGAPVLLGRLFFKLFFPHGVHDGYAFIAGFYLLWACYLIAYSIDRMDKRRQRRGGLEPRAQWPLYLAKRSLLWVAQTVYMVFFLGIVIPTLLALVMEFYLVQPIRQIARPAPEHRIRIVDMWALGLLYSKIFIRILRMQPGGNDFIRGIDQIMRGGWTHPDPFRATKDVIAPLTFGLVGMLFFPAGVLWALRKVFMLQVTDDFLFLHVYPSIFTVAGFGHTALVASRVLGSWSQTIRDKEFLVEMRLQNLELEANGDANTKRSDASTQTTAVQERAEEAEDAEAGVEVREEDEEDED
ncbi:hypothetical protein DAEQUDRAFT_708092 [Daedalea quercina L-15889]|uniref:RING-type E3 ubiquitin transferase n=1 Tax=Daedalea quercina L-15889 TaxID=1314783 RepID=A0A165RIU8_9APHY|nr:hypothetical protein DAEQUDRAFT_708092 [Daedalea quercina L-15889]